MNSGEKAPVGGADRFCTTRWSVILLSARSQEPGSQAALAELCKTYWYPIYAFVRRRGYDPDKAQDLTQGFFLHLLDRKAVRQVNPVKGKFRSFLAASLQNYLSDEADRRRCLKRGGNVEFIAIDSEFAEHRYRLEAKDTLSAGKVFDARWAMTLLNQVTTRVASEYAVERKAATFEALKPFLAPLDGKVSPSYEEAAKALGIGEGSVKTLIYRLRKRFSALLREEVGRTVSDPRDIDEELHSLCEAIIATEGQWVP
jgi:RNA polymerase sigma factor (sigma-70 family)